MSVKTAQSGNTVLLAAVSIIVLGTGLVLAQLAATKSDTSATAAAQTTAVLAQQGAAAAAAAGVALVNGLSTSGTCAATTGCGSGIYGVSVLSGGAASQSAAWWGTSGNVHSYSYPGLTTPVAYAIEELNCNTTSGLTNYKITARAVSNSSKVGLQAKSVVWYYATATHTWAPTVTNVTLYDYSCDAAPYATQPPLTQLYTSISFTVGAAGNLSSYNVNAPYPAFSSSIAGGTGYITELDVGYVSPYYYQYLQMSVYVNGATQYYGGPFATSSGQVSSYSQCSSGSSMVSYPFSSPVAVSMGQSVVMPIDTTYGASKCLPSGCPGNSSVYMQINTMGYSPGNSSTTQMRYRVLGYQTVNNCPVAS